MTLNEELILSKIEIVVNKLMNLDMPDSDKSLTREEEEAIGIFARDFGIMEWDWPQGVGLFGLGKLNKYHNDNRYLDFLENWYKTNIENGLPSKNINTTTPLLALVDLLDLSPSKENEALCIGWANWLMESMPRTRDGGFQHVTSANGDRLGVRLNDSEIWIDTLFMTVLFLNKMGHRYNNKEWISESLHQMLIHIKYLYDKQTGLFHHGWSFSENGNFGEVFWCRGNSWFTIGILEFIDSFKGSMEPGIKAYLLDTFKAQAKALKGYQSSSGLWHTVIDDKTSYEEVSGSAAIAVGLLKGIRMGILDDSYKPCAEKAIEAIIKNIDKDGTVLKVSGGTGIGYNKDHYRNIIIAPMAYGQSLVLLALTETLSYLSFD